MQRCFPLVALGLFRLGVTEQTHSAYSLVVAHVNEHGDGVVIGAGPKEMVGLLPLSTVRGVHPQATGGVLLQPPQPTPVVTH